MCQGKKKTKIYWQGSIPAPGLETHALKGSLGNQIIISGMFIFKSAEWEQYIHDCGSIL